MIVVTVNNSHTPQLLQLSKESDHCSERSRRKKSTSLSDDLLTHSRLAVQQDRQNQTSEGFSFSRSSLTKYLTNINCTVLNVLMIVLLNRAGTKHKNDKKLHTLRFDH